MGCFPLATFESFLFVLLSLVFKSSIIMCPGMDLDFFEFFLFRVHSPALVLGFMYLTKLGSFQPFSLNSFLVPALSSLLQGVKFLLSPDYGPVTSKCVSDFPSHLLLVYCILIPMKALVHKPYTSVSACNCLVELTPLRTAQGMQ